MRDMNAEQREALRARWTRMTPEQREAWMREHAPRRGKHGDRKGPPPRH